MRDRARVRAVIDGSAINQDGRSATFTAPNVQSQTRLIFSVLAATGLAGGDIGYHEAHGSGTALGDPVEMRAVATAMRSGAVGRTLYVGSRPQEEAESPRGFSCAGRLPHRGDLFLHIIEAGCTDLLLLGITGPLAGRVVTGNADGFWGPTSRRPLTSWPGMNAGSTTCSLGATTVSWN